MSRSQLDRSGIPAGLGDDDTGAHVLHVDMDAFFASCELRSRPELHGRPVIVGSDSPRSVVLAASYEARRFGVHSAMPMSRARRLCPQAVLIEPTRGLYRTVSDAVMGIMAEVTDRIEPLSLDEAFLDVGPAVRRMGRPARIGQHIRARVRTEQGITCSVGVAATKHVAKLASTQAKPDGLLVVPTAQVLDFLHPLPVSALWGVGERTGATLARLGLRTVGDLAHTPVETLRRSLGAAAGSHLFELAWGRDPRAVEPQRVDKSIGAEETFASDLTDPELVKVELLRLAERVASRLRRQRLVARTVALKVRFSDFTTVSRSRTLPAATDVAKEVYATACALYDAMGVGGRPVRLVGVRAESLAGADAHDRQLAFGEPDVGWREAEVVADQAAARFGADVVRPATLLRARRGPVPDPRHPSGRGPDGQ